MLAALASGCQTPDSEREPEQIKAVTYYTIDGLWELTELNDKPLSEDTMLYIDFDRKEHRFEMWDNFDSMYMTKTTGMFAIEQDEYERYILSGWYDYGVGDWASDYIVEMTILGDYMLWQSMNNNEKMLLRRVEKLPEF
jgi:hypothetical protein